MITQTIADEMSAGSQTWTRQVTVKMNGHKVRATVKRDSHDPQSNIFVEIWSPATLQWNTIHTLSGTEYKDLPSPYGKMNTWKPASQPVVDRLFEYAEEILS